MSTRLLAKLPPGRGFNILKAALGKFLFIALFCDLQYATLTNFLL